MPKKTPPKTKPKLKPDLSQRERFIEYAKNRVADESGDLFEKAMSKVAPPKKN